MIKKQMHKNSKQEKRIYRKRTFMTVKHLTRFTSTGVNGDCPGGCECARAQKRPDDYDDRHRKKKSSSEVVCRTKENVQGTLELQYD